MVKFDPINMFVQINFWGISFTNEEKKIAFGCQGETFVKNLHNN
jgi:hypothetical protein